MFRPNAEGNLSQNVLLANINIITVDSILDIQKYLEPYDIVSLVFLLYDVPDTALQRLITYQRVSRDMKNSNLNLLYEWALYAHAKDRPTWRYELLEALTICRLYSVIKKLGFNVESVKEHYDPNNIHVYVHIHPVMKLLYKVCENITLETLLKLKDTFISYGIDVTEHEYSEIIFLELICNKFIAISYPDTKGHSAKRTQLEKLARVLDSYNGLEDYARILLELEIKLNNDLPSPNTSMTNTPSSSKTKVDDPASKGGNMYAEDLKDVFQMFQQMNIEDIPIKNLKSDTIQFNDDVYPIYNPKRVGVCCVINQEKFHPSKHTIESQSRNKLSDRLGSRNDQLKLEETMNALNFVVKVERNLKYKEIFDFVRKCIQFSTKEDSMFILCILSHGVRDHIFSSDSLKVKVEDIQNMLDSNDALHLRDKPKVLILQACRVEETPEVPQPRLVADSATPTFYLPKSHFLVYWATAPEFEAFRDEKQGSIFIQALCYVIKKKAMSEQLCDICTIVTNMVTDLCTKKQHIQVPIFESSLRRKLYLCMPSLDNLKLVETTI